MKCPEVLHVFGVGRNRRRQLQNHSGCGYLRLARGFFGGKRHDSGTNESKEGALSFPAHRPKSTQCRDLLSSISISVPGSRQVTSGHVFNIVGSPKAQAGASWDLQWGLRAASPWNPAKWGRNELKSSEHHGAGAQWAGVLRGLLRENQMGFAPKFLPFHIRKLENTLFSLKSIAFHPLNLVHLSISPISHPHCQGESLFSLALAKWFY